MKPISNKWLFAISVVFGVALVLAASSYDHWTRRPEVTTSKLTTDISVAEQIQLEDIPQLKARGFAAIIDLRPDGEAAGQPAAQAVESAAHENHMGFTYVPVPHGDIPDAAVTALSRAILTSPHPILLYCRSGRRAVRTWSLAEASRPDGLDTDAIHAAVRASGQSAEDLNAAITQRIALRTGKNGDTP